MSKFTCPALVKAVQGGRVRQVRLLLQAGSNANSIGGQRRSVLTLACQLDDERSRVDITQMLLEYGADQSKQDDKGRLALHYACLFGYNDVVSLLLEDDDVDLNRRDVDGNTPLALAVSLGHYESVCLLVRQLAKYQMSVDVPDNNNICPIMKAKLGNDKQIFFFLKQYSQLASLQWRQSTFEDVEHSSVAMGTKRRLGCILSTPLAVPQTPDQWQTATKQYVSDLHILSTSRLSSQTERENESRKLSRQSTVTVLSTSARNKSPRWTMPWHSRSSGCKSKPQAHNALSHSTSLQAATSLMFMQANQMRPDFPQARKISAQFNVRKIEQVCKEESRKWNHVLNRILPKSRNQLFEVVQKASKLAAAGALPTAPPHPGIAEYGKSASKTTLRRAKFSLAAYPADYDRETCDLQMLGIAEYGKSASNLTLKRQGKFSLDGCLPEYDKETCDEMLASLDKIKVGETASKDLDLPVVDN